MPAGTQGSVPGIRTARHEPEAHAQRSRGVIHAEANQRA